MMLLSAKLESKMETKNKNKKNAMCVQTKSCRWDEQEERQDQEQEEEK